MSEFHEARIHVKNYCICSLEVFSRRWKQWAKGRTVRSYAIGLGQSAFTPTAVHWAVNGMGNWYPRSVVPFWTMFVMFMKNMVISSQGMNMLKQISFHTFFNYHIIILTCIIRFSVTCTLSLSFNFRGREDWAWNQSIINWS